MRVQHRSFTSQITTKNITVLFNRRISEQKNSWNKIKLTHAADCVSKNWKTKRKNEIDFVRLSEKMHCSKQWRRRRRFLSFSILLAKCDWTCGHEIECGFEIHCDICRGREKVRWTNESMFPEAKTIFNKQWHLSTTIQNQRAHTHTHCAVRCDEIGRGDFRWCRYCDCDVFPWFAVWLLSFRMRLCQSTPHRLFYFIFFFSVPRQLEQSKSILHRFVPFGLNKRSSGVCVWLCCVLSAQKTKLLWFDEPFAYYLLRADRSLARSLACLHTPRQQRKLYLIFFFKSIFVTRCYPVSMCVQRQCISTFPLFAFFSLKNYITHSFALPFFCLGSVTRAIAWVCLCAPVCVASVVFTLWKVTHFSFSGCRGPNE